MGCDIHLHVEIKVDNRWLHYNHPTVHRHYALFGRMAGVRALSPSSAIAPPRGLPADASKTTYFDRTCWGIDGHSDSWLSSREVETILAEFQDEASLEETFGYLFGGCMGGFHKHREGFPDRVQDFRLVFWFDN